MGGILVTLQRTKVLGIIPARGGSKGIPNKNIKNLCGKPLIAYSILSSQKAKLLDRTIVSTDSQSIMNVAKEYGANVPFLRPKHLATDNALSVDVVIHSLESLYENEAIEYDIVVLLQPTTPFRTSKYIDDSIRLLVESGCDSVVSFVDVRANHPARMYKITDSQIIPILDEGVSMSPRQELEKVYIRSGDIYACRKEFLLKEKKLMGGDCRPLIIDNSLSINIDTINDFFLAERLILERDNEEY